jgi:hypothetical protein
MKYLRFVTYVFLLAAVFFAMRRTVNVVPVTLEPATYLQQSSELVASAQIKDLWRTPFVVKGGLPADQEWTHREGPDFDVWTATYRARGAQVMVGIYVGGHPQVQPPGTRLSMGRVGEIPVIWWKRIDGNYFTRWDAIIPKPDGASEEFVHVWISSLHPLCVQEAAEQLRSVRFSQ